MNCYIKYGTLIRMKKTWIFLLLLVFGISHSAEIPKQVLNGLMNLPHQEFRKLVETETFNPDAQDRNKNTLLHHAALLERELHMESLIEVGADLLKENNKNQIPLDILKESGADGDIIELIERATEIAIHKRVVETVRSGGNLQALNKWNVDARNKNGETPLFIFIKEKNIEAFNTLIKAGASLLTKNHKNQLPVDALKESGMDKDIIEFVEKATEIAMHKKVVNWVRLGATVESLKSLNVNARDKNGNPPLLIFILERNVDAINKLIKAGANLLQKNNKGQIILDTLKEMKADKDILELTKKATEFVMYQKVVHLVKIGASVETLKNLNVNARDRWEAPPLFTFVMEGDVEAINKLIKAGADINLISQKGHTVLHKIAAEDSKLTDEKTIRSLIRMNKLNLHTMDSLGYTPLHTATLSDKKLRIGEIFFEEGARLNTENLLLQTPLDTAEDLKNERTVSFLKKNGARSGCHQAFKSEAPKLLQ